MRDSWLTATTVFRLVAQEHWRTFLTVWPRWRRRLSLVLRWTLALSMMVAVVLWSTFSVDAMCGEQHDRAYRSAWAVGMAVVSLVALVAVQRQVIVETRRRFGATETAWAALRAVWSDPNTMLDRTLQPWLEQAVDGRGKARWYGFCMLLLMMAGWGAVSLMWGVAMAMAVLDMLVTPVLGTPFQRRARRERAQRRRAQAAQERLEKRAHGTAFSRWQRTVLDRHPDEARALERKLLGQAIDGQAPDAPARPRQRL